VIPQRTKNTVLLQCFIIWPLISMVTHALETSQARKRNNNNNNNNDNNNNNNNNINININKKIF